LFAGALYRFGFGQSKALGDSTLKGCGDHSVDEAWVDSLGPRIGRSRSDSQPGIEWSAQQLNFRVGEQTVTAGGMKRNDYE